MNRSAVVRIFCACALVWVGSILFAAPPTTNPATKSTTKASTRPATHPTEERRFLNADEIQKIRQAELRSNDIARVQIPSDVRRAFVAKQGLSFSEFNTRTGADQAVAILENGDESMKAKIRVVSDPTAIIEYKKLQPMIITGCAAMSCHGGTSGGELLIYPLENEAATYTNFYILTQFSAELSKHGEGIFGGASAQKLVERGHGAQSLLAQYGLAPAKSKMHHPDVGKTSPMFRDEEDSRYRRLIDWMDRVLRPVDPEYGIDFPLPHSDNSAPATRPSSNPTTTPATHPANKPTAKPATNPSTSRPVNHAGDHDRG